MLVAETVEFAGKEAANKGIEIKRDVDQANGVIWSDPYEIRQVLFNLLTNAIAAVGHDGTITVSLNGTDSRVVLSVEDTGDGIPKENMEKIFEPFFTTKPPGVGTGLGLYVSSGIVKRLGGTIDISSKVGKGTRFQVTLPRIHKDCEAIEDNKDMCIDILNRIKGDPAK
jgi:signal transduction histidine kinase